MITALAVLSHHASVIASDTEIPSFINYDGTSQRISASVHEQPLDWVIEQLEESAGIEFMVFEDEYAAVNAEFENLPVDKAIAQLLYGASHMISYGDVIQIFVLSREDGVEEMNATNQAGNDSMAHDGSVQPLPPTRATAANNAKPQAPQDLKGIMLDSLGDAPEFAELRMHFEQMQEMELTGGDIQLLQGSTDGGIANSLLNNLLQADIMRSEQSPADAEQSLTVGE